MPTSKTSALPQRLEAERLPCLATRAPAAAATSIAPVDMLTDPMPSPPVPTMSRHACALRTGVDIFRMALAKPTTSSGVSPCQDARHHHQRTARPLPTLRLLVGTLKSAS